MIFLLNCKYLAIFIRILFCGQNQGLFNYLLFVMLLWITFQDAEEKKQELRMPSLFCFLMNTIFLAFVSLASNLQLLPQQYNW